MSVIERAVAQMESWARNDSHGYDQSERWGPDYDCSSAVIQAWENAGVPVKSQGASYTGNMRGVFLRCGFEDVTGQVDISSGAGLERGDVLLNHQRHTAMYCGGGVEVEASINELGTISGGQKGDQTGREFLERSYRDFPWDCVLRYTGAPVKIQPSYYYKLRLGLLKKGMEHGSVSTLQELLQARGYYGDDCDGVFGEETERAALDFQRDKGLEADGEIGALSWTELLRI